MRKRVTQILSILTVCIFVFLMFPHVSSADELSDLKTAYNECLMRYEEASANLALKQDRYEGLQIVSSDNYIVLTTEYGMDPADLEVTEENYWLAYQEKLDEEQTLINAQASLEEAKSNYQNMWTKLQDGTFSFYQWVKQTYPQYKKDINRALAVLNAGVTQGYIQRGNLCDSTSLYSNKLALQYFYQYAALQQYFQDDATLQETFSSDNCGLTNFELMAYAQYNAAHASQQNEHLHDYLDSHNLGENLIAGQINNRKALWKFYDGHLSPNTLPLLTVPQTGNQEIPTFEEWLVAWKMQHPTIEGVLPWLNFDDDAYIQAFLMEKYRYEMGLSDSNEMEDFIHMVYGSSSGFGIAFTEVNDSYANGILAHDYSYATYNNLFTIDTYESLLDEYIDSIGFVNYTGALEEAESNVTEQEDILLEARVLDAYFSSSLSIPVALVDYNEAHAELESAAEALAQARDAYGVFVPMCVNNVHVENMDEKISVQWDEVSASSCRYFIYRRTPDTDWTLMQTQFGTSYVDTDVVSGTQYEYGIVASNKYGKSDLITQASIVFVSAPLPNIKTGFYPRENAVLAKIEWNPVNGATGYEVYQNDLGNLELVATVTDTQLWICGSDYQPTDSDIKTYISVEPSVTVVSYQIVAVTETSRSTPSVRTATTIPPRNCCTVTVNNKVYEVHGFESVLDTVTGEIIQGVPMKMNDTVTIRWPRQPGIASYDIWRITKAGTMKQMGTAIGNLYRYKVTGNQNYYFFAVPHISETLWVVQ